MSPEALTLEHFVPSWWHCLGKFRSCGLADGSNCVTKNKLWEQEALPPLLLCSLRHTPRPRSELWVSCPCLCVPLDPCLCSAMLASCLRSREPQWAVLLVTLLMAFYHCHREASNTMTDRSSVDIMCHSSVGCLFVCLLLGPVLLEEFTALLLGHVSSRSLNSLASNQCIFQLT